MAKTSTDFVFFTAGLFALTLFFSLVLNKAEARPLSYPDGVMVMFENNGDENAVELNYTLTPKTAIAYHGDYQRDNSATHHAVQLNNLLWRGNFPDSQANVYAILGAGVSLEKNSETNELGYAKFMADWEDRRYYTSYSAQIKQVGNENAFTQKARLGIAPYVANAGALHTWVMVEAKHKPEEDEPLEITPLIRLFEGTNLLEVGYSNKNNFLFNYTKQF